MDTTLEQVIRRYIPLPSRTNATGWYPVLCRVCNDHGKKGPRGGFKFDNDTVGYHCFNCGHKALYDPPNQERFPNNMEVVLRAFGVPDNEWKQFYLTFLQHRDDPKHRDQVKSYDINPITLPKYFVPLASSDDEIAPFMRDYLLERRGIQYQDYPFYHSVITDDPGSKKWYGRVIIPIYKGKDPVFYIGRDITDSLKKKYETPSIAKHNLVTGFDRLLEHTDDPLYVVEGWFDAYHINGVAVLQNAMTEGQQYWLNWSKRTKVVIPDRFGDGKRLGEQAINNGWSISTPDIGDCKDINEAIMKYGALYVKMSLREHTYTGYQAKVRLERYCKD